jgi:hypothetical protein
MSCRRRAAMQIGSRPNSDLSNEGHQVMSTDQAGGRARVHAVLLWGLRLGLVLALVAAGYLGLVFVRHDQRLVLPAPTGPYHVGRMLFTWTEGPRPDPLAPRSGAGPRQISVWLWFPAAKPTSGASTASYLPGAWAGLHLPAPVGWAETAPDKVNPHTVADGRVAAGRFPVMVLLPGLGFAAPQYSSLAVDLASHGYLVAGLTPTDSANLTVLDGRPVRSSERGNPGGFSGDHTSAADRTGLRLVGVWANDAMFAARRVQALGGHGRFAGHVNATRVAYVGHSFGGASALEACRRDARCLAAGDLDGTAYGPVVTHGLSVPLLLVEHQGACVAALCVPANASDRADLAIARSLVEHSRGPAWSISIDGTAHFDFTDYAAYYLALPLRMLLPLGRMDGNRALHATGACLTGFLDATINAAPVSRVPACATDPEVHVHPWHIPSGQRLKD